jgi:signal transduction histidine kinase
MTAIKINQLGEVKEGSFTKISSGSSLFSEMISKINLLVEKLKDEEQKSDESYKRKESCVIQASEDLKKLAADIKGYTDVLIETKKNDSYELKLLNKIAESADNAEIILNSKMNQKKGI